MTSAVDGACRFQSKPNLNIRGHRAKARSGCRTRSPAPPLQGQARGEVTPLLLTPQHRPLPRSPSVLGTKAPASRRPRRWRQERPEPSQMWVQGAGPAAAMLQTLPGQGEGDRREEGSPAPPPQGSLPAPGTLGAHRCLGGCRVPQVGRGTQPSLGRARQTLTVGGSGSRGRPAHE